ncbi:CHAT domain-containing protein [Niabella pedocola]|uniref:CHAT domain-containing protein n=1 Tax=Niabella pedocola TaxID=1752077 RepID=A0ABS8PTZ7_9BACT|nr:CHAT domain-containing tetratricopeptide repeat protein [Niabella pedocola]MCD2424546.1 CHAT domain-containing protein [Niabella pedocola]
MEVLSKQRSREQALFRSHTVPAVSLAGDRRKTAWHKKKPAGTGRLRVLLMVIAFTFFSGVPPADPLESRYRHMKQNDSLEAWADFLFDQLDLDPGLAVNREEFLKKALWRPPRTREEKLACYQFFINTGWHLLTQRQVPTSITWYEQAYAFYERNKQDTALKQEMDFEEYIAKPLGNNYTRVGDFSKAVYIQQRAINEALTAHRSAIIPGLYLNLATTYFRMHDDAALRNTIALGLQSARPGSSDALPLYNLKAEAYLEAGNTDSADIWNQRALLLGRQLAGASSALQTTLLARARILNLSGKHRESLYYLEEIRKQVAADNIELKVETAIEAGNAYLLMQQPDSAAAWHQRALAYFRRDAQGLFPDFKVTTALFGVATALLYKDPVAAARWFEKAVLNDYYTEQLLPASLNSSTAAYANKKYSETAIALYHQLFDQHQDPEYLLKALWLTELSKGRVLINEQRRTASWKQDALLSSNKKWVDQLRSLYVLLAETPEGSYRQQIRQNIQRLEFELNLKERESVALLRLPSYEVFRKWVQTAGRNKVLLSYYLGDSYSYIIQVQNGLFRHRLDTATATHVKEIGDFMHRYFYAGPAAFNRDPRAYYARAAKLLYTWNPWFSGPAPAVLISPDRELHNLPFEALCIAADTPAYWGASTSIGYSFTFLQNAFAGTGSNNARPVTVFSFEKPHLGFPGLPQSLKEGSFLAKHFVTQQYSAAGTSDSAFMAALNTGNIIHLASHAVADPAEKQPYLVLKNKLYLGELQYITTRSPLVVLAACETGSGLLQQGEGMQSLGRILLSKGVDGVLSSRWEIDDAASGELIREFYQALATDPDPASALKKARVAYLKKHQTAAAQNPLFWAAYFYQGNDTPLWIRQKRSSALMLSLFCIAGAVLVTTLFFRYKKLL